MGSFQDLDKFPVIADSYPLTSKDEQKKFWFIG